MPEKNKPTLKMTTRYSAIEPSPVNRSHRSDRQLFESMNRYGWLPEKPAIFFATDNERWRIIDGHHRVKIAKDLKIPIWFVESSRDISPVELESNRHAVWSTADFATAYANSGHVEYINFLQFKELSKLPFTSAVCLYIGRTPGEAGGLEDVRRGKLKSAETEYRELVVSTINRIHESGVKFARTIPLIAAIGACCRATVFDVEEFCNQMDLYVREFKRRQSRDGYLEEIEMIYNFKKHKSRHVPIKNVVECIIASRRGNFNKSGSRRQVIKNERLFTCNQQQEQK